MSGYSETKIFDRELPDDWVEESYEGPHIETDPVYGHERTRMKYGDAAQFNFEIKDKDIS